MLENVKIESILAIQTASQSSRFVARNVFSLSFKAPVFAVRFCGTRNVPLLRKSDMFIFILLRLSIRLLWLVAVCLVQQPAPVPSLVEASSCAALCSLQMVEKRTLILTKQYATCPDSG